MKKILTLCVLITIAYVNGWGQTAATATWALTASPGNVTTTGNVTGVKVGVANGLSAPVYTTAGVATYFWNDATTPYSNTWYQYAVTPTTGNTFNVTSISLTPNVSTSYCYYSLYSYILPTGTAPTNADFYNYSGDVGSPYYQVNTGNTATNTISGLNITVPSGYTLYIRVYAFFVYDYYSTYFYNKNVTISGVTYASSYCTPTYASQDNTEDYISNVTLSGTSGILNNTSSISSPAIYYSDYTTKQPGSLLIPNLVPGKSYTLSVTMGNEPTQYSGVWIDFNRDNTFSTTEFFSTGTSVGANGTANISITVPAAATAGITRMRVRGGDDAQPASSQACGADNSTYGETEDYSVNIVSPPTVTYTALSGQCSGSAITLSNINIVSSVGVSTTANLPRIYYKLSSASTYTSQPLTLTSGTATNSIWSYTFPANTFAGGTTVQYFVVAQDISSTPVIGSSPTGALSSTNSVSNITTLPSTVNSFAVAATPTVAAIGGSAAVCAGATTTYTDATTGGTWSVISGTGTATITSAGVLTGNTAGTVTVVYTVTSGSCSNTATKTVTVNALPTVSAISGNSSVCINATATYTDATTGGTWSVTNGTGSATITTAGVLTGVTAGTVTVVYTYSNGTCSNTATKSVTVNALPTPTITTSASPYCVGSGAGYSTETGQANYVWTFSGTAGTDYQITNGGNSTSYFATVKWLTSGSKTVTVNYTNSNGCTAAAAASSTITVNTLPTAVISGTTTICNGSSTNLTFAFTGVSPWSVSYTNGTSNYTANSATTPATVTVSPTTTTTYTLGASSVTDGTGCASGSTTGSAVITVNQKSVNPTSASAASATICNGGSTSLTLNGGGGGISEVVKWYTGTCGGTLVGTGNGLSVSPTVTTTYYGRYEDGAPCNYNSGCASVTVTVNQKSTAPTSATATSTTICDGSSTTLSLSGGNAGTSASIKWYTASCGGTLVGTGNNLPVSPTVSTTYYGRYEDGAPCSVNTACASVTITVNQKSTAPTSASAASPTICIGSSTTLTLAGGSLGANASVKWYTGSCGGTLAGTGNNLPVSPTVTTTYYGRYEDGAPCSVNTTCASVIVTVNQKSTAPTTISSTATNNTICNGQSTTLSVSGGTLGTNAVIKWYANGCGSGPALNTGSSATLVVNPTATTTYYARYEDLSPCSINTGCVSITITVNALPTASLLLTPANGAACEGSTVGITFSGTAGSTINYGISPGNPSINATANTGTNSSSNAGDYTYTINSVTLNGCAGTVSNGMQTVHIVAKPDATITGFDYVQIGNQINLAPATSGGAWSSNNTGAATVNASTGVVTGASSGTAGITYQVSNTANGITCIGTSTKTINITADYVTRNNGNFSDFNTWKRGTVNGFVNANSGQIPTLANTIEVQNDLFLDQDFQVGSGKSFVMSAAGTFTIRPGKTFSSLGSVNFGSKAVTVQSNAGGTGAIGQMASNIANADNVTVERYTQAGSSSGRRAWRLVTSPITDQTIHQAWQEGKTWIAGGSNNVTETGTYGTLITGESLSQQDAYNKGFDYIGGGNHTSIRSYQYNPTNTGGNWAQIVSNNTTGTNISLHDQPAYMLFIRGDRLANSNVAMSPATLRAHGTLNQASTTVTVPGSRPYTLVGNPYAAPLNFENIYNSSISNVFMVWNSSQGDFGAYNTVIRNSAGNYSVIPFNSQTATPNNNAQFIESGGGFFVSPSSSANGSITIGESAKSLQAVNGTNTFREVPVADKKLWVNLNLQDSDTASRVTDGLLVRFSNAYAAGIDNDDVIKQNNFNENMSVYSQGKYLTLEARDDVKAKDTVYLRLWSLVKRNYRFQVKADDFGVGAEAYLEDNYLGTKQPLKMDGSVTNVDFSVTADAGSYGLDRFHIVFQSNAVILPVTLTSVKAAAQNGGVTVSWTVTNEVNIKSYTIEKSADGGRTFTALGSQQAAHNNANSVVTAYDGFDAKPVLGDNFYRIRIEAKNGTISYSNVVKATIGGNGSIEIAVYPNPVRDGKVNLSLTNLSAGNYLARIYSNGGQVVYQRKIIVGQSGMVQNEELKIGKGLAQGSYQLRITNNKGEIIKETSLIVGR